MPEAFGKMLMNLKQLRTIVYDDELKQQQISLMYISSDLQEELLTGSCQRSYWTDGGSSLHPHTSRRTCKRNFSQDHASAVTEQTEDLVFIHVHLVGPTRGTSHRIMPAQLLNRQRISSSSTYISSNLQEELLTARTGKGSYWTDGGSRLHPHTSRRTCRRNFSQDHASAVTEHADKGSHLNPHPRNGLSENFQSFFNHDFE